ncbi:unnamed protein product [Lactuca saligna]|uniref:Di19 zinc-binding domain-containing protein n=1 Tax=Lactuca saligna TaxID=75948 RepID=A0AA35ZK92_LACSI|nr:unnamed protein product [Lactuca saligna]
MCSSRLHSSFSGEITCKKQSKAKQHPLKSKPTKPPLIALVPIHYSPTHPQFLSFICDFNFPSNPSVNPSSISIQHLPLSIMDADSWAARLSSTSKRYQYALQSRSSDMFMGFEDIEVDDDIREEFPCPFCTGYFDVVGLCCHIDDEHHVEAKNGVCPICAVRVGVDMVAHITLQHGNIFKISFFLYDISTK